MGQHESSESDHPIAKFETLTDRTPNLSYSKWIIFLKNLSPKSFLWQAR